MAEAKDWADELADQVSTVAMVSCDSSVRSWIAQLFRVERAKGELAGIDISLAAIRSMKDA
jgi:hypothetical protein